MWLVTRWLYRMSRVVEMKPQPWHKPFWESVWTFKCRSQFALVVKADRQIKHTNGRSPEDTTHTHIITYKSDINDTLHTVDTCPFQEVKKKKKLSGKCLTAVCSHVYLQRAGTGAAFVALREWTQPLVRVWIFRLVLWRRGSALLLLAACAVVHKMGLKIPLTSVPDPTVFARENVLCTHKIQLVRTKVTNDYPFKIVYHRWC